MDTYGGDDYNMLRDKMLVINDLLLYDGFDLLLKKGD